MAETLTGSERHTFEYGEHPSQRVELFLPPPGEQPAPVCVAIHGGFWRQLHGADQFVPVGHDLASHGVAMLNLEYRRVGGEGGWPATCADVLAGTDTLALLPDALADRVDLGRVVALGHSAGGHLAGWLAGQRDRRVPLTGFVSQAGVLDLEHAVAEHLGNGATSDFLSGAPLPEVFADASPIRLLPTGVPSVLVHGDEDVNVPLDQSERYHAAATAAGDRCRLTVLPGVEHFAVIQVGTGAYQTCRDAVLDLLGRGPVR